MSNDLTNVIDSKDCNTMKFCIVRRILWGFDNSELSGDEVVEILFKTKVYNDV